MRFSRHILPLAAVAAAHAVAAWTAPAYPFAPAAGSTGSTAVAHDDPRITGWAVSVAGVWYGPGVDEQWRRPEAALGPATAGATDVLVLGDGGAVVLGFDPAIRDGQGDDFAVFENAFSDTFLELAHVEVSTDGVHFVRFPNYSLTPGPVGAFGDVAPEFVHGLAGKYRAGFGTPFDIAELAAAHAAAREGQGGFSAAFRDQLVDNYPLLDPGNVRFVRLVDIAGDGSSFDCEGFAIFDPYPTAITAGFDLDGIAVMNASSNGSRTFADWSAAHGLEPLADADTDGDKWPQYLEYLFGTDPSSAASRPRIRQTVDPHGAACAVEYARSASARGALVIEYSHDARSWVVLDTPPAPVAAGADAGPDAIGERVVLPLDGARPLFVRFTAAP